MKTSIQTKMGGKEWLILIILSVFWGGSFFFVEIVLKELPTLTIVALRVAIAAIVLWGVVLSLNLNVSKSPKLWFSFILMGLLNNAIPFSLITWGQTQIISSLASILNAAMPFFTIIVARLLLPDEKVSVLKVAGVVIGFTGVTVMIGLPETTEGLMVLAQLAILAAGLSYAVASAYGRRFREIGINPFVLAAGQIGASSLIMLPIALSIDGAPDVNTLSIESMLSIFSLAVFSTAIAYVLYFKILASSGAVNISLVTLLVPVSAILLGVVVLGESLEMIHIIGMAIIALGLITIDGRLLNYKGLKKT